MPFKSKAQMRKCFSMKDKHWDCKAWAKETKNIWSLPEHVKKKKKNKK